MFARIICYWKEHRSSDGGSQVFLICLKENAHILFDSSYGFVQAMGEVWTTCHSCHWINWNEYRVTEISLHSLSCEHRTEDIKRQYRGSYCVSVCCVHSVHRIAMNIGWFCICMCEERLTFMNITVVLDIYKCIPWWLRKLVVWEYERCAKNLYLEQFQ